MRQKPVNEVVMTFLSRSANEGFARTAAACFVAQLDPTLDEVNDVKTAVSEAVTNAIVHAYPQTLGKITLRLRLFGDQTVEILVKDNGVGIEDVDRAREPLYTTGNEERSGMGFTIMESFMDRVRVRSTPGKGTTVVLSKQIARRVGLPV
ncbi:anti-sigma F factor [Pseudoflavonifractor gallinarum]|uniref:Anti-sigma F factor n=1 Tax=Pseudoflavonifractor hominis TaxID=2763059 RepID=A0ABR7HVU3_9FIRM|nr:MULTISPECIES: anti-sigma F factor [Eubacteriales]MBC5731633.1 anti-sigma F factor [Pseudoflavonifractor hominis]MBS5134132.1 anti-sigma F factor [Oscillospiraceae bacterium]MBT9685444.1 anti-sigma F factor [Pseudoflavonifractor sp. MCC625]